MIAALLAAALFAQAATADAGPPTDVRPAKVLGPGIYVRDLEAQKAWYMAKLGMVVVTAVPKYGEYIMGFGTAPDAAILTLQKSDKRPAGPNVNSRVILGSPNAKALAGWLKTQGVESREAVKDVAFFINDPEGNPIELYTPPPKP